MPEQSQKDTLFQVIKAKVRQGEFADAATLCEQMIYKYPEFYGGYWELSKLTVRSSDSFRYGYHFYVCPDYYYYHHLIDGAKYTDYYKKALRFATAEEKEQIRLEIEEFTKRAALQLVDAPSLPLGDEALAQMTYEELLNHLSEANYGAILQYFYEPVPEYYIGFEWENRFLWLAEYQKREDYHGRFYRFATRILEITEDGTLILEQPAGEKTFQISGKTGLTLFLSCEDNLYEMRRIDPRYLPTDI